MLPKTLNEDVKLQSNQYNQFDIAMENGDYVNVTGLESLHNAIIINILTRFKELDFIELYENFGCRAHELIKDNKNEMLLYKLEVFIEEVLENMRRIQTVDSLDITETDAYSYEVKFSVTSITDEIIQGELDL